MSGAPNSWEAMSVKVSEEDKRLYITVGYGHTTSFPFTILCDYGHGMMAFDVPNGHMLFVTRLGYYSTTKYQCVQMSFHIENDLPIPSARYYLDQDRLIDNIADDFKDKLASYTLDGIINSSRGE
jgi:hypothetical protein